jgi:hypothetical protein
MTIITTSVVSSQENKASVALPIEFQVWWTSRRRGCNEGKEETKFSDGNGVRRTGKMM